MKVEFQYSLRDTSKKANFQILCTPNWDHKVMEYMDLAAVHLEAVV